MDLLFFSNYFYVLCVIFQIAIWKPNLYAQHCESYDFKYCEYFTSL